LSDGCRLSENSVMGLKVCGAMAAVLDGNLNGIYPMDGVVAAI